MSTALAVPPLRSGHDPFARIADCTSTEIEQLTAILELRGRQRGQAELRAACFAAAGICRGDTVAEVGCGTGVVAQQLAELVGPSGAVVGIDRSERLLAYAQASPVGSPSQLAPITYQLGDAYQLVAPDRSFDATVCVTLLSHLARPELAVAEMHRITRSGGRVIVLDQDYGTLVFDHSDVQLTRSILAHACDRHIVNAWCGRGLHGVLAASGLAAIDAASHVYTERDGGAYLITVAQRIAMLAARDGAITQDQAQSWLDELALRSASGRFFASLNYYAAWGRVS